MCGVVFKTNFDEKPVNNEILQQYDKQSSRGKQGYGVFDLQHKKIFRAKSEDEMLEYLVGHESNSLLLHHRMPTSTINVPKAAHPLRTGDYFGKTEYVIVHNGIIRNANDLFVSHQEKGIQYSSLLEDLTFNDSESLLWDFALTMEGKQEKMTTRGDMAFICVKLVKGEVEKLYFGRDGRPLMVWKDKDTFELSSEGRGTLVPTGSLNTYDFKTDTLTSESMVFDLGVKFHRSPAHSGQGYRPTEYYPKRNARNEYRSYDEYHLHKYGETKKQVVERKWNALRSKAQSKLRLLSPGSVSVSDILDMQDSGSGEFILDNNPVMDVDRVMASRELYEPTSGQIQNLAMDYLMGCQGKFEEAYSLIEFDYADRMDEWAGVETMDDIRQQLLYEAAMEFINSDPEYENEDSVSSIYQALYEQQPLALGMGSRLAAA